MPNILNDLHIALQALDRAKRVPCTCSYEQITIMRNPCNCHRSEQIKLATLQVENTRERIRTMNRKETA